MMRNPAKSNFFKLQGKTLVCIDWANVYGWQTVLGWEISPQRLYSFLEGHEDVGSIRFYFGRDSHPKSRAFLKEMKTVGYHVVTKEVKYVPVTLDNSYFKKTVTKLTRYVSNLPDLDTAAVEGILKVLNQVVRRRKCDFDIEVAMDVMESVDNEEIEAVILFSGDGDYAPLVKWLLENGRQVAVVFAPGRLGKEISQINKDRRRKRKVYLCSVNNLKSFISL